MKPTQRLQKDSVCDRSRVGHLSEVPPIPASAAAAPSKLHELVLKSRCYPRLMQEASWTLAAPFKEQSYHRSPSDSIANNYTPTARDLKLKNLHILKSSSMTRTSPGPAGQEAVTPSLKELAPSRKRLETAPRSPRGSDRSTPALRTLDLVSLRAAAHRPELDATRYTEDQPLTPEEQFVVMHSHEEEMDKREMPPSGNDMERYWHYVHSTVQEDVLAPQDEEVMNVILQHIPSRILANPYLENSLVSLKEEVKEDYCISLMKAIVDYVLMDPAERERLLIGSTPRPFPLRVIRAPVPWHSSYKEAKSWNESNLFVVNPLMHTLHQLWLSEYSCLRFVRTEEIRGGELPLLPAGFVGAVRRHCVEARDVLLNKSVPPVVTVGDGYLRV